MKKWFCCFLAVFGAMSVHGAPTNDGMYATLQTDMGDVCFELYYTSVPRTVANFVSLAEGTRPWIDSRTGFISSEPFYNGIIFHRVITNFMIQCGSPKGDGTDGPGYTFEDEFDSSLRHDAPGVVSMANSGFDSNGSQFFITVENTSWLDDVHTVFGRVVEGMNVVSNIAAVAVNANDRPLSDVTITNVFITRNGADALSFAVTNQFLPEVEALPMTISSGSSLTVSTETAASSYQYIYSSSNLAEWSEATSRYWPEADGDWTLEVDPADREFFHASRVIYTPDADLPSDPTGHQFTMIFGGDEFRVLITGTNSGVIAANSDLDHNITSWSWSREPNMGRLLVQSDYYVPFTFDFYYSSSTDGRCRGYYYYYGNWYYLGSDGKGIFADSSAE